MMLHLPTSYDVGISSGMDKIKIEIFFYLNPPKRYLPSVVRIEGQIDLSTARVWELPNDECGYTYCACSVSKYRASGYSLAVLAVNLFSRKDG